MYIYIGFALKLTCFRFCICVFLFMCDVCAVRVCSTCVCINKQKGIWIYKHITIYIYLSIQHIYRSYKRTNKPHTTTKCVESTRRVEPSRYLPVLIRSRSFMMMMMLLGCGGCCCCWCVVAIIIIMYIHILRPQDENAYHYHHLNSTTKTA